MTVVPTPQPPSRAPQGGTGAWRPAFLYGPSGASGVTGSLGPARPLLNTGANPDALRQELVAVLQESMALDLVGAPQVRKLASQLSAMQPGQLDSLKGLLEAAGTRVEQAFILKAFAANEPWNALVQYAGEMRGMAEAEIIRRSTMRDDNDLIQQWQDSCGPTVLQTAAGEIDPRYAWELNKAWDLSRIDPLGANSALAAQQQQWLETYGGRAVMRGQQGGAGMALTQLLNDMLTPLTGVRYRTVTVQDPGQALAHIAATLQAGYDVPLRISWDPPSSGSDSGHFVLAMAARRGAYGNELQIHDPWTGQTAWVSEASLLSNQMPPMFSRYARLTHFYQPTAGAGQQTLD